MFLEVVFFHNIPNHSFARYLFIQSNFETIIDLKQVNRQTTLYQELMTIDVKACHVGLPYMAQVRSGLRFSKILFDLHHEVDALCLMTFTKKLVILFCFITNIVQTLCVCSINQLKSF